MTKTGGLRGKEEGRKSGLLSGKPYLWILKQGVGEKKKRKEAEQWAEGTIG